MVTSYVAKLIAFRDARASHVIQGHFDKYGVVRDERVKQFYFKIVQLETTDFPHIICFFLISGKKIEYFVENSG